MRRGSHHTSGTKAKMRAARNARKDPSAETRARMSAAHMGNQNAADPTEETRKKMSAAAMGNKNLLGHRHSPETLAKLRGPNYRAHRAHYARVYENAWGPIPHEDSGRAYGIHHRDGNRHNDDPENLIALTNYEHATLERALIRGDWDLASEIDAIGVNRRHAVGARSGGGNS